MSDKAVKESTLDKLAIMRGLAEKLLEELANGETVETEKDAQHALKEAAGFIELLSGELPNDTCDDSGQCPYHASGGPDTIRCGTDRYRGRNSKR